MDADITATRATELGLEPQGFVYRLWAADGTCVYVGQHVGYHPGTRIAQHHRKPWWKDVSRIDYLTVGYGEQHELERQEISRLKPRENKFLLPRIPDDEHGYVSTYNNKRCRCDQCREAMRAYREQQRLAAIKRDTKELDQDKLADLRLEYRIARMEMELLKTAKSLAELKDDESAEAA